MCALDGWEGRVEGEGRREGRKEWGEGGERERGVEGREREEWRRGRGGVGEGREGREGREGKGKGGWTEGRKGKVEWKAVVSLTAVLPPLLSGAGTQQLPEVSSILHKCNAKLRGQAATAALRGHPLRRGVKEPPIPLSGGG